MPSREMTANDRRNVAAVLHRPGDVRIEPRPMPALGPRDVLVEVRSVGVCGSDVHYYEHGRIGSFVPQRLTPVCAPEYRVAARRKEEGNGGGPRSR